jgi:hypothetical protein
MREYGPTTPLTIMYYGSKHSRYKNVCSSNSAGASSSSLTYIILTKVTFWMRNAYKTLACHPAAK